jgi:hypothetical protein
MNFRRWVDPNCLVIPSNVISVPEQSPVGSRGKTGTRDSTQLFPPYRLTRVSFGKKSNGVAAIVIRDLSASLFTTVAMFGTLATRTSAIKLFWSWIDQVTN